MMSTPYRIKIPALFKAAIDHIATTYTLPPKGIVSLAKVTGHGFANVFFTGDGYPEFLMEALPDGLLEDFFPANQRFVGAYAFESSLEIRLRNPTTYTITGKSSSFELRGMMR